MSTTTDKLALFKYDPSTDGAQTFNIQKALNDNWDNLDDAVKEILITLANKAAATHAAQHAKGGSDPITPESIRAAPGGHGLGDTAIPEAPNRDVNKITTTGWYMASVNTPTGGWWLISSITYGNVMYQFAYANEAASGFLNGTVLQRSKKDALSDWTPWEYINPPMRLGIEYRTTERYLGKPVYCKAINAGKMPTANNVKLVAHGSSNIAQCIKCIANWGGTATFPYRFTGVITADRTNITLDAGSSVGLPLEDVMVCFYYTKTTD